MFRCLLIAALLCLPVPAAVAADAKPAAPYKTALSPAERQQVTAVLEQFRRARRIRGLSAAISVNGKIVYSVGLGFERPGKRATAHSIYAIGQITQQFTAGAILLLQQRGHGKIKIRQSLNEYFAGVVHWRNASIGHLLAHSSGIPDLRTSVFFRERVYSRVPQSRVLGFIKARSLKFQPGRQFEFSDANYFLLANVIEVALELFYHDYIKSEFYQPLLMKRSGFLRTQPIAWRAAGWLGQRRAQEVNPHIFFGSADATSTAMDLQNWNFGLMRTKLFLPISRRILFTPFVYSANAKAHMGAGFYVRQAAGGWREYFSFGVMPGYTGINKILHQPASGRDVYVTILTNQSAVPGLDPLSTRIARIAQ